MRALAFVSASDDPKAGDDQNAGSEPQKNVDDFIDFEEYILTKGASLEPERHRSLAEQAFIFCMTH